MTDDELQQVKNLMVEGTHVCNHEARKEEILVSESRLYHQVELLRAFIIERMVDGFQEVKQEGTQFPWKKTSHEMKVKRAVQDNRWSIFEDKTFPLTIDDLVELGAKKMEKGVYWWGKKASREIAEIMKEFGYPNWETT